MTGSQKNFFHPIKHNFPPLMIYIDFTIFGTKKRPRLEF
ncbi:hypothetical protein LfDm3_0997 [Fructilactobacillus fructivorans]|uniref:Uncharacterized protein n=1 Tax=Fructilactobacillus fructivorans TaxID=1614 RepID=A0A0C1PN34_9LACO|nr:hypothetical protein LfDm3_0997 [Fructilactobacillus fructivorans]